MDTNAPQQKSWFRRNWLWFVPLSGCLGIILLIILGIGAAFFGVSKMITNATPISYAMEQASKNKQVIQLLGEPIERYGIPDGNISFKNDDGEVDFSIPIKGDKDKGVLVVKGTKTDGEWSYEQLFVHIKSTQEKINLLAKEKILDNI